MLEDRWSPWTPATRERVQASESSNTGQILQPVNPPTWEDEKELEGELLDPSGVHDSICGWVWKQPGGEMIQVAVKVFKPAWPNSITRGTDELKERVENALKREVFIWTRLNHQNIHPILGFRSQPSAHLISNWCYHGNLAEYLRCNPQFSRLEKVQLLLQTSRGLAYLHSQSPPICHANIKPENILVNDRCEAALTDFGLSQLFVELGIDGPKGGPDYMAPELFEAGNPKPSPESDVYAFGGLVLAVMGEYGSFAGLHYPKIMYLIGGDQDPAPKHSTLLEIHDKLWLLIYQCRNPHGWLRPPMTSVVNELAREADFLARPPEAFGQAEADVSQLQVDSSNSDVLVSSNVQEDRCEVPVDRQCSVDVATGKHRVKLSEPHSQRSPSPRSQMFLHNLQRQGKVFYRETAVADGLGHCQTWTATVLTLDGPDGNIVGTYIGQASTKQAARDTASAQVLATLGFASVN